MYPTNYLRWVKRYPLKESDVNVGDKVLQQWFVGDLADVWHEPQDTHRLWEAGGEWRDVEVEEP